MDALRHINNVQFVRLLEQARVQTLQDWFTDDSPRPALLIARTEIDYLTQLRYRPEPVVITSWVTAIGGASFDLGYEVKASEADDAEVYAVAESTQVNFDLETQRPQRLDPQTREVLQSFSGPPAPLRRRASGS